MSVEKNLLTRIRLFLLLPGTLRVVHRHPAIRRSRRPSLGVFALRGRRHSVKRFALFDGTIARR